MKYSPCNTEQYLSDQGCTVEVAYFENSAFKMGYEFFYYGYRVIYRVEHSDFIICHLEVINKDGQPGEFLKLFNLLHQLGMNITGLSTIRMMIVDNIADPTLQLIRQRLMKLLIAKGAFSKNIDGDDWLLFDVS
ncbi:TPA: pathogenicity island 2 effector protein SseE [Yersinia enterocolitica]|uniref:pathogenicity island 2 effector protein SseE n=1 Tax=Yersinia enterocolitica TaxID=630 RepID=UPI00094B834D|nr:pathogenicity island 2 effector protein SseE [Yersinia enterocolitica]HEN3603006.1 pathogenicity island 2 effector protein SseE [Yersinia enterocolitica]HEN3610335.1 pathogenicity island 2 effector protein SseE [Yersinia enterocolitica]HEN3619891.1 pathogenicity island 2 effector protein SseE [Yersinia enterocolitica]HEN3626199.1 pathogenicity island 2 effector protein SseE [Yersinia enterocolitica]HEN3640698.1 pathogenicity island 2 effector protein SseE [Yersinia enterocolitica]